MKKKWCNVKTRESVLKIIMYPSIAKHHRLHCGSKNKLQVPGINRHVAHSRSHPKLWHRVTTLQWRHNERDGVSNHQPPDCLLKRFFMHILMKTSKPRVTGLSEGNSPMTGEFPAQRASNVETCFHLRTSSWSTARCSWSAAGVCELPSFN